jgi:transposase
LKNIRLNTEPFCVERRLISIMQDAPSSATPNDSLPEDPAALRAIVSQQRQLLAERQQVVAEHRALVDAQRSAIKALEKDRDEWRSQCEAFQVWLDKLNRARYGRSSERDDPRQRLIQFPDDPVEALALAEALDEAVEAAQEVLEEPAAAPRKKRRKRAATTGEFPAHLPRIVETIEAPESVHSCPTHGAKTPIGFDETQTLEYLPPTLRVRVRRYPKFVCEKHAECGVTQPVRVPALVEGNRFDLSVAIAVILAKYWYHLPLYRQQDQFAACGWTPSRSTLANLLEASDELLLPFVQFVREQVLAGGLIGTDDTSLTLITPPFAPPFDETDPRSVRTHEVVADAILAGKPSIVARIWAYRSLTSPLNYFDFTVSRHRDGPAEVLADFQGTLMADCYSGYESSVLSSDARIIRVACWSHARRKFEELQTKYPLEAAQMLALERMLRDVEDRARPFTPDERRALRETDARPVLEKIREFVFGATYEKSLPKSSLRAAMNYVRNNWDELQVYVTDGRCPIDNNDTEQLMRQVAVGRKNWLFVGSLAGGERAARFMTVVSSALRNDLDVERYLSDIMQQLLNGSQDYHSMLPHVWRESHPDAVRTYREDERRDASDRKQHRREERRRNKPLSAELTDQQKAEILRRAKAKLLADRKERAARRAPPRPSKKDG